MEKQALTSPDKVCIASGPYICTPHRELFVSYHHAIAGQDRINDEEHSLQL